MKRSKTSSLQGLLRVRAVEERVARRRLMASQAELRGLEAREEALRVQRDESETYGGSLGLALARGLEASRRGLEPRMRGCAQRRDRDAASWREQRQQQQLTESVLERRRQEIARVEARRENQRIEELARAGRAVRERRIGSKR
ncbi:MAG: hypothetical protein AAF196_18750 [Planctomycetota bacterium]